jgi:hypothetical protein
MLAVSVLGATLVFLALLGVAFGSALHSHLPARLVANDILALDLQQQNATRHVGDIVVEHNDTLLIQDCQFNQTGKLIIKDNARVTISNSTFISNWNPNETPDEAYWRTKNLILQNQSRLTIMNSQLILSANASYNRDAHCVIVCDEATLNITDSEISYSDGLGDYIYGRNSSRIWMRNAVMSTFYPESQPTPEYPKSGLAVEDESQAEVQNSTLDYAYVGQTADSSSGLSNCTLDIDASKLEYLEMGGTDFSTVKLSSSNTSRLDVSGRDSSVRLTNTTVGDLNKNTSARIVLFDSSIQNIYVYAFSNMWIVWELPLFGQVEIPYTWAPYVIPLVVTSAVSVSAIIGLTLFFNARRKRRRKNENAALQSSQISSNPYALSTPLNPFVGTRAD